MSALDQLLLRTYREKTQGMSLAESPVEPRVDPNGQDPLSPSSLVTSRANVKVDVVDDPTNDDLLEVPVFSSLVNPLDIGKHLAEIDNDDVSLDGVDAIEAGEDATADQQEQTADGEAAPLPDAFSADTVETDIATDVPRGESSGAPFRPEWEVDRFRWPAICDELAKQLDSQLDDAIRQLRDQTESRRHVVMMTSFQRGVGRTSLVLCLARRAAERGIHVAVVDLDYQNPQLMSKLGVYAETGMESLANGATTAESICIAALEEGVSLLPMVKPTEDLPWDWANLTKLLQDVADHHDLILLDVPPAEELLAMLDNDPSFELSAVVVRDARQSSPWELRDLVEKLRAKSVSTAGVVDNFAA